MSGALPCGTGLGGAEALEPHSGLHPSDAIPSATYVVKDPRTGLMLAKKPRPKNVSYRAGFGQDYRWVRTVEEAERFNSFAEAELPTIYLNLRHYQICPLLSCGLLGDAMTREQAQANGTFHSRLARSATPKVA